MIQPQELRMGNIVYNRHNEPIEVDLYDLKHMFQPRMDGHGYTGIPIDMNWLIRLGFKSSPDTPWLMENGALMCNTGNHWIWHWSDRVIKDIKYVHELQNVMFALSGRELEIK